MKFKYDSKLPYQDEAIRSVTDLFEGMPSDLNDLSMVLTSAESSGTLFNELGVANPPLLDTSTLLGNLHKIQARSNVPKSRSLIEETSPYPFPNYSVEMETGTGKTYVYLRTIFELNKLYGFKKFIIVVPSVAIREGVTSSIRLMREHFAGLYDNVAMDDFVYNSKDLNRVRQFAVNNEVQIMVINIQAFVRDTGNATAIIHQEQDKMSGRKPIEYVQATDPVVIIDEPQSVDNTENAKRAITGLNPLLCLRYSATHRDTYNLLYQLDPIRAYDLRLVKQIEVVDSGSAQNFNNTMVKLNSVGYKGKAKTPHAIVTIFENTPNGSREKQITIKHGAVLYPSYTNRQDYENFQVTNINAEPGNEYIEFMNGERVELFEEVGGMADDRMRSQIRQTIEQHFAKEKKFKDKGIKVLSLFFIDAVKSYRSYDDEGNRQKGKMAQWFEEEYAEVSKIYKGLIPHAAEDVHDGYFSADRKKGKIVAELDTTGSTAKDDETYRLIMQDKERLLSHDVPLRFIFSHSALREGWDSPNVFQICYLREVGTDTQRRQTIGRGLRLPVNRDGDRIQDDQINRLTVIANESFADFAQGLQADIEQAIGGDFKFGRVPKIAFTPLLDPTGTDYLTQEQSDSLWKHLNTKGFIDIQGDFTDTFKPTDPDFSLDLPVEFAGMDDAVTGRLLKFLPREFVKNARKRELVKYNKRVELNPEFKILWDKISQKTRYSVKFETPKLVALAVDKIKKMAKIEPVKIDMTKRSIDRFGESGIEDGKITGTYSFICSNELPLPDVLAFLQRETELTRGTLVQILKESGRLKDFTVNPQAFMTETTKLINRALHELIVDGIKYEPIPGQFFEMRLFEQNEVEEYLDRCYHVEQQTKNDEGATVPKNPYEWIPFDSDVEKQIAERLDSEEGVKFFCKLPRWFRVATPLGDYNPDWALVHEHNGKLYLVRETKSTLDRDKRRESENKKVDCGKAHFEALGVPFEVATTIHGVLQL